MKLSRESIAVILSIVIIIFAIIGIQITRDTNVSTLVGTTTTTVDNQSQNIEVLSIGLIDVTTGAVFQGFDTKQEAVGSLQGSYKNSTLVLNGEIRNLPIAPEGYQYRGLLVNEKDGEVASVGTIVVSDNDITQFAINQSVQNLHKYNAYIVILQNVQDTDINNGELIMQGDLPVTK